MDTPMGYVEGRVDEQWNILQEFRASFRRLNDKLSRYFMWRVGIQIRREMLRRALTLVGAGALAGGLATAAAMPLLTTFLAGVSPFDPIAFAGAAVILAIVGLAATYVPVRRASHVDPMRALRDQ